jgi:uncharacterized protein (DUF2267 family)
MHATGLAAIDRTVEHTLHWVDEVCREMRDEDRAHGWVALRAVLQHLRDLVDADEARQLAAQLPMLLRGLFFEGYTPQRPQPAERDLELFLDNVRLGIGSDEVDPEVAARAVFAVLRWRMGNEALQARARLSPAIRDLWPLAA